MSAYHIVLVHFPIALWTTAVLAIFVRAFSDGELAKACDRALLPLLTLSIVMGAAAFIVGLTVWPLQTVSSTPLGRNHMLSASWSLSYWILLTAVRWRAGEALWQGMGRWIMAGLAAIGGGLLTVTGTLGGHLTGTSTAVSEVLRFFGWEIYTTYYVPDFTLAIIVVASIVLLAIGFWGRRRLAS